MALVTVYHPVFKDVTKRVHETDVPAWASAGWVLDALPDGVKRHADVTAVEDTPGFFSLYADVDGARVPIAASGTPSVVEVSPGIYEIGGAA